MTAPIPASFNVDKGLDGILVIPINGSLVTAGNSDAVNIKLENRYVSRRHFQIRLDHDVFYISDLGSTNGTYLNGTKLTANEENVIRNGDMVGLGVDQVLLTFSGPARTVRLDTAEISQATRGSHPELVVDSSSRDIWVRGEKLSALPREAGIDMDIISKNLGHASVAITLDIYAHLTPEVIEEAAKKIESRLFGE